MKNLLHIYGQEAWHGDAFIVGDTTALTALRDAIDKALLDKSVYGGVEFTQSFTNDGEGYTTAVVKLDKSEDFDRMAVPYTAEEAAERRDVGIWPWEIKRVLAKDPRNASYVKSIDLPEFDI